MNHLFEIGLGSVVSYQSCGPNNACVVCDVTWRHCLQLFGQSFCVSLSRRAKIRNSWGSENEVQNVSSVGKRLTLSMWRAELCEVVEIPLCTNRTAEKARCTSWMPLCLNGWQLLLQIHCYIQERWSPINQWEERETKKVHDTVVVFETRIMYMKYVYETLIKLAVSSSQVLDI